MLRKLAAVRGLVNSSIRARVWPLLLGLVQPDPQPTDYEAEAVGEHDDVQTIKNDVARSLHSLTAGAPALGVMPSDWGADQAIGKIDRGAD